MSDLHNQTKLAGFAAIKADFIKRWRPRVGIDEPWLQHDFEVEVDRLVYTAMQMGAEPFVRELSFRRENAVTLAALSPVIVPKP
jgi:hypothetical protein